MSLYDQLGGQQPNAQPNAFNAQEALQQLKANPSGVLKQAGLTIPDGMNNPNQIIQHLLTSGQLPQARLQQAMRMLGR